MLGSSPGPVVATLYHKYMGRRSKVHVYISNPPLHCQFIDNSDRDVNKSNQTKPNQTPNQTKLLDILLKTILYFVGNYSIITN